MKANSTRNELPRLTSRPIPKSVCAFFWQYDATALNLRDDYDLIVGRILACGDWRSVTWLRKRVGDPAIREWILNHRGRGLTPQQLRFWEFLVRLPHRQVNAWLADPARQVWDRRTRR